jgi:hypothetical protein
MLSTAYRAVLAAAALALLALAFASTANTETPAALTPDGGRYFGPLLDGKLHGKGRIEWASGTRYEGELRGGLYWGKGELRFKDGRSYHGEFVSGSFHGKGRFEQSDGDAYEGDFAKGEFTGKGSYLRKDGARYDGGFRNWKFHGKGRYTDNQGTTYEGTFADGELKGSGRITRKESTYEGDVRNWQPHGKGIMRHANGDIYEGAFEFGAYSGEGTLKYADGKKPQKGVWRYGSPYDEKQVRKLQADAEAAIYAQKGLLDKVLAALEPGKPGRIDMYLLAVGGDGSQEVFRREVDFVQKAFAERFGTAGRSVALVNSRNTLTSMPMATVTSIGAALKAIGARMDRDEDILFLFMTSHGSSDHQLVLSQGGMALRGLPAKELAGLLKESGIRWKVVLVSACYSGGFIDPLQDGRTLVITAARRDRRSFGCADENDFTYFGRAFFKESLPASRSFRQAFGKAVVLVEDWESKDRKDKAAADWHSLPQISSSGPIDAQLQRWWAQLDK